MQVSEALFVLARESSKPTLPYVLDPPPPERTVVCFDRMARGTAASPAGGLRAEVAQVLSELKGGSHAAVSSAADPFNERNEWEDAQRRKGAKGARSSVQPGSGRPQPKSRRAQQALRAKGSKESAEPPPLDPTKPGARGALPNAAAEPYQPYQLSDIKSGAGGPALLPGVASWWEELAAAPNTQRVSALYTTDADLRELHAKVRKLPMTSHPSPGPP